VTLNEFQKRFQKLKDKGFIPTTRKGTTGVGHTLETALGLTENNIAAPDIDKIEIKAHRDKAQNLITLFTFNKSAWQMPPLKAIKKYGSKDKNGRLGMYYTMSQTPNSAGLFLNITKTKISVQHISGEVVAIWKLNDLAERFIHKIPALLFISARTEERDGKEYFHFYRARLMKGTKADLLGDLFKTGDILVDLRLHDKGTRARNHGTGFRAYESKLDRLFTEIMDL